MARTPSRRSKPDGGRHTAQLADQTVLRGEGGETHQVAGGDVPVLTTQLGTPVSDDQNSLRIGRRGPTALEDFHFREKIFSLALCAQKGLFHRRQSGLLPLPVRLGQ